MKIYMCQHLKRVQANAFVTSPLEMIYRELHFSTQNSVDTQGTGLGGGGKQIL